MLDVALVRPFLEDRHEVLIGELLAFIRSSPTVFAQVATDELAREKVRAIARQLGAAGLLDCIAKLDLRACALTREALAYESSLADAVFALQALGCMPILVAGDTAQKKRYLPGALGGSSVMAFAMTETQAGSDVGAIATTARRDGDHYVLEGKKTLISNAGVADLYCVFASTDLTKGSKGLSCFVVPADTGGLQFVGPQIMSVPHPLGELSFDTCRVPVDARLGAEGEGLKIGLESLDRLRATVAAAACGMAARALGESLTHARARRQFGKTLGEFQLVQDKLARMAIDLHAARLLTYRAVWEKDRGSDRVTLASAMAKAFATEAAQRIVDQAVQISGGLGVLENHPVERLYRAVRALRIYEGTTEIQHLVIAKELLRASVATPA